MTAPATTDMATLPALVRRAADALAGAETHAEVLEARERAALAYDAAKRAGRLAKAKAAHDGLIAAAHRAQADALEIEAAAKRRLADEYDAAQERGEASKGGRPKTVPDGNGFTAADAGLSRKDVFEARQMRDALARDPGIVRQALDQLMEHGDEPTRTALKKAIAPLARGENLRAAVGTASASKEERGNNLYETPPEAVRALLALEGFSLVIWEPACGKGAISRLLEDAGHEVLITDLVDYGTVTQHGEVQEAGDFLETRRAKDGIRGPWRGAMGCGQLGDMVEGEPDIVTNPPYGAALNAFVAHALREHRPRKMALLLNLNFLCGFENADRNFALDACPPARIHVFTRRLPMMHRDGWDGPEAASRMNTAWFVWERDADGAYRGPATINRVDWKDFETAKLLGPIDAAAPADEAGAVAPPAAPARPALRWHQEHEGGRILGLAGSVEVGAIFPPHKTQPKAGWGWTFFLAGVGGFGHKKAKSEAAAKAALTKHWHGLLDAAEVGR